MFWDFRHRVALRRRERDHCLSATNTPTTLVIPSPYTILNDGTNLDMKRSAGFAHFVEQAD
jgi:hypothetical protein